MSNKEPREASMFEYTKVQVCPTTRAAVARMLQARGDGRDLSAVVEEALQAWLVSIACSDPPAAQAAARGYQWKSLFLPEGTCLRFDYKKETFHAEVRGDRIVYQERAYSPRQLLLHITGTVRNAWRELWIRAPGDFRWHLADTRRHILRRTPRGRHRRGIDATGLTVNSIVANIERAALAAAGKPVPAWHPGDEPAGSGAMLRAILYRDDLVRADQPDLTNRLAGGGRVKAGRAGPRDRRWHGYVAEAMIKATAAFNVAPSGSA
jgi:hypothetical protein